MYTAKKIKICKKNSTTLDGKHKEFLNDFANDEADIIPTLKSEKIELREKLSNIEGLTIEDKMDIQDRINEKDNPFPNIWNVAASIGC